MNRSSNNNVNYQQRALEFSVGDIVSPFGSFENWSGRVTAVWPAIGMVDVESSSGNKRYPAEDLQRYVDGNAAPPHTNSAPSTEMVSVGGTSHQASAEKVALYWASKDRKYRMTRPEMDTGKATCPRCDEHPVLKRAIFRRRDGQNHRLLGCKNCLFLIHEEDILTSCPTPEV